MGCWIVVLIVVVLIGTIAVFIGHFVGKAKKTEQALNDLYGEAVAYVPEVRIITPPSGIKDARQWVQSGATAADVQLAIDATPIRRLEMRIMEVARR